jgi:hypothetical protein
MPYYYVCTGKYGLHACPVIAISIVHKQGSDVMLKIKRVLATFAMVSLPVAALAADGIHEGMWEITSKMEMPGMPMEMPPTVVKHCYTKEDASDQKKVISRDKECTVTDFKSTGNKVSWQMKCTGKHPGSYSGETEFSGDSYVSTMKMESGKGNAMVIKATGKRIGNCS